MSIDDLLYWLGVTVVLAPAIMVLLLGGAALFGGKFSERVIGRIVQICVVVGFVSALLVLGLMLANDKRNVTVSLGNLVHLHGEGHSEYHFAVKFIFDRLSLPFALLSFMLCGTIGAFAIRYMHREQGFNRFFTLYAIFVLGMILTSLAGTIETLFVGWELVGLSSALLVAFFHERSSPVRNGLRVWIVYRISDAALLTASVVMHHMVGAGDFEKLMGIESWPDQTNLIDPHQALIVGSLLLVAAAGKSALVPFSGWLPRAMEGPTPSSAVFYGALSVHLGAFLLLRTSPLLDSSPLLCGLVVTLGLLTAIFAAIAGRVQTDIKSALSFASLTQVGIIVAEIGLGLRYIALIHILGHACLRTLQFLRAPTLLHDYRLMENALGERIAARPLAGENLFSERLRIWSYRFALERGYLDAFLVKIFVTPLLGTLRFCDRCERRWTDLLAGGQSRESEDRELRSSPVEEMI